MPGYLDSLDRVIDDFVTPGSPAHFPLPISRRSRTRGFLGLLSATEAGGQGLGMRAASEVVERIASACGSTAMVLMMHYCAVPTVEALAPIEVRRDVAAGKTLLTLAFSEAGSHAPDTVTREITRLARADETRHVAFALGHIENEIEHRPAVREGLRAALERRYDALKRTAGLGEEVFDALVVLAAGSWASEAIARGHAAVSRLQVEMAEGRERRLIRLGFPPSEAATLSALHTRNFM